MVDLRGAQQVITTIFQTNAATIYRPVEVNTSGTVEYVYAEIGQTTCHFIRRDQLKYTPTGSEDLGEPISGYLTFPIGTALAENDRIHALERTWRVVYLPPVPDFSLDVLAGVVDISGAASLGEVPVLLDDSGAPLQP